MDSVEAVGADWLIAREINSGVPQFVYEPSGDFSGLLEYITEEDV
jgi:hypothetical protein